MDPEFGEDKFDRLRDEAVPDAILRATDLLETEALGIWDESSDEESRQPVFSKDVNCIPLMSRVSTALLRRYKLPSFHFSSFRRYRESCVEISPQLLRRLHPLLGHSAESERDVAYAGYQRAMVLSSGASYGTDVNNLGSLQSLARVLEIEPIPR
ncbi:hypothetical protein B0H14DRAFT_3456894 [Mycena olivaceomarginata]|nr:hypothetical protein B0H14DRAFT_3456894 [Mycena olivaceomarginata]